MGGQSVTGGKKLGVVYEPDSVPILVLVAAVRGRWPLVWIVRQRLDSQELARLRRFGECVDLVDAPLSEAVERLRDLGLGGITTFADEGLVYTAELATALGLPANSPQTAVRLTNKLEQRSALAAAGLPTPPFCRVDPELSDDALKHATEAIPYPAVVKPAVGTGGRDTTSVASFGQLAAELQRRWSAADHRTLIVEHCLGTWPPGVIDGYGDYLSVEVVVAAGHPQVLAVTGRMPLAMPFRETGMFAPSNLTAAEDDAARAVATSAARALGVEVGCLHVEIKRTPEGPRVIEVNGRVAGGGIPDLVLSSSGDNLHAAAAAAAMGEPVQRVGKSSGWVSYSFALQPPVGKPSRLVDDWRARLDATPGISHVEVRAESVTVQPADGSYGYMLMVFGEATDHDAMRAVHIQMGALIEPAHPAR
jgi:predicted ATP-grasp superfamily ATP-dependent carboligase